MAIAIERAIGFGDQLASSVRAKSRESYQARAFSNQKESLVSKIPIDPFSCIFACRPSIDHSSGPGGKSINCRHGQRTRDRGPS